MQIFHTCGASRCRHLRMPCTLVMLAIFVLSITVFDLAVRHSAVQSRSGNGPTASKCMSLRLTQAKKLTEEKSHPVSIHDWRRQTLKTACSHLNLSLYHGFESDKNLKERLFFDPTHKMLYCGIEKVGCTFWKRVLMITTGLRHENSPYDIPGSKAHAENPLTLLPYTLDKILNIYHSSRKFIFVREPYSRLFSGYIDKIFSPTFTFFIMRRRIAANRVKKPDDKSSAGCAPVITFAEFVNFLVLSLNADKEIDSHFLPMFQHCRPCNIHYDVIGKMESFASDVNYVFSEFNLTLTVKGNLKRQETEKDTIINDVNDLFTYKHRIDKCMPFTDALKYTWRRFQIRGLIDKSMDLPSEFITNNALGKIDFEAASLKANEMSDPNLRKQNRREALAEALRSVDPEDLAEYLHLFRPDFDLFGYQSEPRDLFKSNLGQSNFSFFTIK